MHLLMFNLNLCWILCVECRTTLNSSFFQIYLYFFSRCYLSRAKGYCIVLLVRVCPGWKSILTFWNSIFKTENFVKTKDGLKANRFLQVCYCLFCYLNVYWLMFAYPLRNRFCTEKILSREFTWKFITWFPTLRSLSSVLIFLFNQSQIKIDLGYVDNARNPTSYSLPLLIKALEDVSEDVTQDDIICYTLEVLERIESKSLKEFTTRMRRRRRLMRKNLRW